jgi:hypothetical protein
MFQINMNKKLSLIKTLKGFCLIGEIFVAIGLFAMLVSIPFSESMINNHRANIGLFVVNGSPDWMYFTRLPGSTDGTVAYAGQTYTLTDGSPVGMPNLGTVSVGPFRINADEGLFRSVSQDLKAQAVSINNIEGTVTFQRPETAAEILATIKWPFIATMLCTGGVALAVLDILRRMFKSVQQGETFTVANIRNVRCIGYLLVASSVLKFAGVAWLVSRMTAYVSQHVAGKMAFNTAPQGNFAGLGTGLVILALAEVFRQGLKLKEDAQFTI